MIVVKYIIIFLVFLICFLLGNIISKRYTLRVKELKDFSNALNIIENKIKFTYEPLSEIFMQTSRLLSENISNIFINASNYMKRLSVVTKQACIFITLVRDTATAFWK